MLSTIVSGLLALLFGQIFANTVVPIGTKMTVPFTGPLILVFFRFATATILLALLLFFADKKHIKKTEYKSFAFLGFLLAINVLFFTFGIGYTTVIMSTLIYSITPVLVGVAGHFVLKEKMNKYKIIGLIISLIGIGFLVAQSLSRYQSNAFGQPIGNILIFIAMLGYSYYVLQSRKILHVKNHNPLQTTFLTFVFTTFFASLACFIAIMMGTIRITPLPSQSVIGFLLVGASSVIQYLFLQIGVKKTNAFTASLFQYIAPFIAASASIPLLKEQVTPSLIIGGLFILTGVFIATTYKEVFKKKNIL